MKKLLLLTGIITSLTIVPVFAGIGISHALGWNTLSGMGKETVKPHAAYKLGTSGNSPRVYEWTPKDNKNITCVFVSSSSKGGVACYPKTK